MKQERYQDRITQALVADLFGDYELIVDLALGADLKLKRRIAEADTLDRGGLAVLKNALRNRQVALSPMLADILQTCEVDQHYHEELKADFGNIDKHGISYRVRLTLDGTRLTKSFTSLRAGQVWRDRMSILLNQLDPVED